MVKINELTSRVPQGSQRRADHPQATDDPDKYIGKWETYDTPQGIKKNKKKKVSEYSGYTTRSAPAKDTLIGDLEHPVDKRAVRRSKKAPVKQARKSAKAFAGPMTPVLKPVVEAPEDYPPSNLNIDITNDETVRKKKRPTPAHHVVNNNIDKMYPGMKPYVSETIRKPVYGSLTSDYEVSSGNSIVGKAKVVDGVIELLTVEDSTPEKYPGEVYSVIVGTIVREADRLNANLSIQIEGSEIHDFKTFMERFGFRRVGGNIMKRLAGSIIPPSVSLTRGLGGEI